MLFHVRSCGFHVVSSFHYCQCYNIQQAARKFVRSDFRIGDNINFNQEIHCQRRYAEQSAFRPTKTDGVFGENYAVARTERFIGLVRHAAKALSNFEGTFDPLSLTVWTLYHKNSGKLVIFTAHFPILVASKKFELQSHEANNSP